MLNLVTGRSGSGKTTYVCSILHSLADSGNNKLLLIVPEQFSFASERGVLSALPPEAAQNIEVLSFTRLADYVHRSLGGLSGDTADEGTKIIVMMRALEGIQDNLEFYASHIKSVSLAKELISLVTEFRREKITPEMLEDASRRTDLRTFSGKLRELALIYKAYDSLFSAEFTDSDTLPDKLCKTLSENDFFDGYTVVIDAFKGFTAQELEIIKHLLRQAENVYITLCTEDIFRNDPSMIWGAVNETAKRIIRIAKEENIAVSVADYKITGLRSGQRFKSEALAFLEKNIFYPTNKTYEKEHTDDIVLCSAGTVYDECNYIAAAARKLIRTGKYRLRDIAVVVRDENAYKRELLSAFARYKIPVFEDARQPIINQPLIALVRAVMSVMLSGFSTENVLNCLKTGLSPLSELEAARLENYALMWGISAKDWSNTFTLNPYGLGADTNEKSEKALAELDEMRKKVILPLVALKKRIKPGSGTSVTAREMNEALYDFITNTGVSDRLLSLASALNDDGFPVLAEEQNRIWEILMNTLDKLSSIYGDSPASVDTYYGLFCAVISVTDLGNIPHGLDEITIGAADRIRLSSPKVVFAAGCAEGVFPAAVRTSGLLTSSDRKNLASLGIELSVPGTLEACEERFIAYTAVTAPAEKLFVSYHRTEGAGESFIPSCIYENIKSLFRCGDDGADSKIQIIDTDDLSPEYFAETDDSSFASYAGTFAGMVSGAVEPADLQASLRTVLEDCGTYGGKLAAIDTVRLRRPFEIKDRQIATELFGNNMFLSASRVDVYHHCAFEYFCKYGIKAAPRMKAELSPAVSGTVIHYVLEKIIGEYGKNRLLAMNGDDRKAAVDKWLLQYLNEFIGGFDDKTLRFKYLYNRLAFSLYDIVSRLCAEFSVSDFIPCDFELPIGDAEKGVQSYAVELSDGGKIEIFGSIDRVDKYEKDGKTYIRIVDYKSGGKEFVLSDILEGLNMQMLIYLFAIWAGGGKRYGNVMPAGILYYPAKRSTVSQTTKHMDSEAVEKEKIKTDRGNGLFLLDDAMLEAMEHGKAGKFIQITDRYGKLKDNLITLENMSLLKKRVDGILAEMAEDLHSGQIPAFPVCGKRYEKTCEYCDYSAVCGFEDGDGRDVPKYDNAEVMKMLSEGGAENG